MQAAVRVFDQTVSEGAKTKLQMPLFNMNTHKSHTVVYLSHRSVEQDLGRNIHMADAVLEVRHHHISSLT